MERKMKIVVMNKKTYKGAGEYVGRPSVLGNPFSHIPTGTLAQFVVKSRDEAVDKYGDWLKEQWRVNPKVKAELIRLTKLAIKNDGITLICWCAPQRCHCEKLAEAIIGISKSKLIAE
jgi:hypothetical protein